MIAIGLAGTRVDFALAGLGLLNPILASVAELIVVWAWHTPLLFGMSHTNVAVLLLEQASFVGVGFFLWLSATSQAGDSDKRAAVGIVGLLLTSMHMALLGTLLNLAPRPLYPLHIESGALADQQLGGLLMLVVGGTVYLIGGLWLLVRLLRPRVSLSPGNRKAAASNR